MTTPQLHFVVSAPRSGSTWLVEALNQHPEVFATEQRLFGNFCELWSNNNGRPAPRITLDAYLRAFSVHYHHQQFGESRNEFLQQMLADYIEFLLDRAVRKTGKRVIVDKITPYPGTVRIVDQQIRKYCPNSRIIQLVRDGRDVATSGAFDWLLKDAVGTPRYQFFVEHRYDVPLSRFFDDRVLRKWARIWRESLQFDSQRAEVVGKVRYEEMLLDQAQVLRQIFNWVDVAVDDSLLQTCVQQATFEKMAGRPSGVLDPTAKQRLGLRQNWKSYFTQRDADIFAKVAGDHLIAEGYESDRAWTQDLPARLNLSGKID